MADKEILFRISADTGDAEQGVDDLKKKIGGLDNIPLMHPSNL
jgi:hypothetical protein